jgi:hypothetical protein
MTIERSEIQTRKEALITLIHIETGELRKHPSDVREMMAVGRSVFYENGIQKTGYALRFVRQKSVWRGNLSTLCLLFKYQKGRLTVLYAFFTDNAFPYPY